MKKLFLGLFMLLAVSQISNSYANEDCQVYAVSAAADYYTECTSDWNEVLDYYNMMYNDCVNAAGEPLDPVLFC